MYFSNIFHHPPYCCLNKNENRNPSYDQSMYMLLLLNHFTISAALTNMIFLLQILEGCLLYAKKTLVLYFSYNWSHRSSRQGNSGHYPILVTFEIVKIFMILSHCHIELSQGRWKNCDIKSFLLKILCGFMQWYVWQNTVRNQTIFEFLFHKPK